jgi:hypothetical protein
MKHTTQEEKGGPTCQEFLSLHKLYAPALKDSMNEHQRITMTCNLLANKQL